MHHAFNQQFWNKKSGCLYDLVTPQGPDPAMRPNQLFALSLPFPLIEGERARRMIAVVAEHLLTPRGLRSLSLQDPAIAPIITATLGPATAPTTKASSGAG